MRGGDGDLPPVRQRVLIGQLVIRPDAILHGLEFHFGAVGVEFRLMAALVKQLELLSALFATCAEFVERGKVLCPLLLHGVETVRERVYLTALGADARVDGAHVLGERIELRFAIFKRAFFLCEQAFNALLLPPQALGLRALGGKLAGEGGRGNAHIRNLLGAFCVQLTGERKLLLRGADILARGGAALFDLGAVPLGVCKLLFDILNVVAQPPDLGLGVREFLRGPAHIGFNDLELLAVGGKLHILFMQRLRAQGEPVVRARKLRFKLRGLRREAFLFACKLRASGAKFVDLALASHEAEFFFLQAAAGHRTAGVDDIPLERRNAKARLDPLVDLDAGRQIRYDQRAAQEVFHHPAVALLEPDQLACDADKTRNARTSRALPLLDNARAHRRNRQKRGASVIAAAQVVDDGLRILLGVGDDILQRRAERHLHGRFIGSGHADQFRHHALHAALKGNVALALAQEVAHARIITLVRALHFFQHFEARAPGFGRALRVLRRLPRFNQMPVGFVERGNRLAFRLGKPIALRLELCGMSRGPVIFAREPFLFLFNRALARLDLRDARLKGPAHGFKAGEQNLRIRKAVERGDHLVLLLLERLVAALDLRAHLLERAGRKL